jgi:monofunctional glycosyltransferase
MRLISNTDWLRKPIGVIYSPGFWKRLTWLAAGLCIFQLFYFIYLFAPELADRWEDIKPFWIKAGICIIGLGLAMSGLYFLGRKITWIARLTRWAYRSALVLYLLQWVFVILYWFINPPLTFTQIGSLVQGYGLRRDYISYDRISPAIKLAVMASEDQLFPDHDGFDVKAIKKALKYNKRNPRKAKGASTISQQTAKNLFLWQRRNFIRKGLEVYFTFMIETFWNKRKILDRYLNIVEMGPGIFGVQAAAQYYFNKNAADLNRSEAAMIAACLPSPKRYTIKPMSGYIRSRYDDILVQMNNIEPDEDIQKIIR